jgi:hypothetical protein
MADQLGVIGGTLQALLDDIDNWCGTPPRPRPHRLALKDLLCGIAIAELSARVGPEDVRGQLGQLANGLIERAQKQIGAGG